MAWPSTASPGGGRRSVGFRSRIGMPIMLWGEQRSRWPVHHHHCRPHCHRLDLRRRHPSTVFPRATRRRSKARPLSGRIPGPASAQPVTQSCSGSGPSAICAAPLSSPRSWVHRRNDVSAMNGPRVCARVQRESTVTRHGRTRIRGPTIVECGWHKREERPKERTIEVATQCPQLDSGATCDRSESYAAGAEVRRAAFARTGVAGEPPTVVAVEPRAR
jgi:hypothetical protein